MIKDLDKTISKLIFERAGFSPSDIEISFKQPTGDWAAGLTRPTITCYLYNIQENLDLRAGAPEYHSQNNSKLVQGYKTARFDLTYFIVAWASEVEDEHVILWRLLTAFTDTDPLPEDLLQGQLVKQPFPIPTRTGHQIEALSNLTDLWNVMDNQFRPSLNYTVTLALERMVGLPSPIVFTKRIQFEGELEIGDKELIQIGGIVFDSETRQPIEGAEVIHLERGIHDSTDQFGRYTFRKMHDGKHRLQVSVDGKTKDYTIAISKESRPDSYDLSFTS